VSLYVGVDSGTQSVKAVVLDLARGRVVAEARAPHRLLPGLPPGHLEQDPREWTAALDRVLAEVSGQINPQKIRAIGVSGQQHGFVPLDERGDVIRPAKLWCDTSTAEECRILTRRLGGPAAVLRRTGLPFLPGYTAPKVLWLKRHEPDNFRRLRHILLPHDYLNWHLTGRYTMERGDASGTGFLDVRSGKWSPAAMAAVDRCVAGCLPPLIPAHAAAGTVRTDLGRRWGWPDGVVVSAGGGDNMMGAIGTGNISPGTVTASFGTSGTIYAWTRHPVVDPAGEIAAFRSSCGGALPLLCTMNVTRVIDQVRALFGWDHAQFDRAAAAVPAGAGGLTLLPYFEGERTPNLPEGTGVLFGLNAGTLVPGVLARAALEGVTLGLNYGLVRLRALGIRPREIRLTGGGARSALWRQTAADVFGVPVVAMVEDEGAALGAALQAAWCQEEGGRDGSRERLAALCGRCVKLDRSTRCEPDPERHALYRRAQAAQDALQRDLRGAFARRGRDRRGPRAGPG
jgi:xylulokinase